MKNKLQSLLNTLLTCLSNHFNEVKQRQLVTHQNIQKQEMYNRAMLLHQQIQHELFVAFHGNHYTNLHPIATPNHIRLHQWFVRNNTLVFQYRISAQSVPAQTILDLMRQNMNTDIYQCQQNLLNVHPLDVVETLYPCILWGLYVIDIRATGNDICISVVTNYG